MGTAAPVNARPPGPARKATTFGHLLGLDQALDGVRSEDHVLEYPILGHVVRVGLIGQLSLDQRRAHEGRTYGGGQHALFRSLERQRLDQSEQPVLGRHVSGLVGRSYQAVDRSHADEAPFVGCDERLPRVLGQQKGTR
jgi:hypothetical protein